jgi:cardiolipin synthase A/B
LKLITHPGDGVKPLIQAIDGAKRSVEIAIFRFDRSELEKALLRAAQRGVEVHALIAYTNRGGEKNLRQLETRLLGHGVTVSRTADDLIRYHGKYMIIDKRELYVLAFNFTFIDMEHSRSFGVMTRNKAAVQEALRLFDADCKRQTFTSSWPQLVVSPANARKQLAVFIKGAKKQLLIYDPKIGDPDMLRLLDQRVAKGIEVRSIGKIAGKPAFPTHPLSQMRLHTRSIIRDGQYVFVGSQSLRMAELEMRREVGLIFRDLKIASDIIKVFEADWKLAKSGKVIEQEASGPAVKAARKVSKAVAKSMPPVAPLIEKAVKTIAGDNPDIALDAAELEKNIMSAVKDVVEESVRDAVQDAAAKV